MQKSAVDPMNTTEPRLVSLKTNFEQFWKESQGKPFDVQLAHWDRLVEGPHQALYDHLVNGTKHDSDWKKRKLSRLKQVFSDYEKVHAQVSAEFAKFPRVLEAQIAEYRKFFPDAKFTLPIVALPGATFNGKSGPIDDQDRLGLAFGIDVIALRGDDADVLFSHELFHVYHVGKAGITPEYFMKEGRMTLPLWLEGLATYVSQVMNPKASLSAVLMQDDLVKLSHDDVRALAREFLRIAKLPAQDERHPERYRMWFGFMREKLRPELPYRVGYLLGLEAVKLLARTHSLAEMTSWSPETAHARVMESLAQLAGQASGLFNPSSLILS